MKLFVPPFIHFSGMFLETQGLRANVRQDKNSKWHFSSWYSAWWGTFVSGNESLVGNKIQDLDQTCLTGNGNVDSSRQIWELDSHLQFGWFRGMLCRERKFWLLRNKKFSVRVWMCHLLCKPRWVSRNIFCRLLIFWAYMFVSTWLHSWLNALHKVYAFIRLPLVSRKRNLCSRCR